VFTFEGRAVELKEVLLTGLLFAFDEAVLPEPAGLEAPVEFALVALDPNKEPLTK
jgi:hypothetical protein